MDGLGLFLVIVLCYLAVSPQSAGRWLAKMRAAHDEWVGKYLGEEE